MSATPCAVVPVTFRAERQLPHRPAAVFEAFADVDQWARWLVPPDESLVIQSHDFRVGGFDVYLRGRSGRSKEAATNRYEHIDRDERIVFTQRTSDGNGQLLLACLIAWDISANGSGSQLTITDQSTSVAGSRPIEGKRYAYELMLDRLEDHLAHRPDQPA